MADPACITLKSNEQGRSFRVRKDRLVKIPYFKSLLDSAWADANTSTFQIETSIKFLTYKIEKLLFVDYIGSDWTTPPFVSHRSNSVPDDKIKASEKNVYSYHGALPPMKPPWLAFAVAKHSIRELVTLYRLADFYDVVEMATAVEVLLCNRWRTFQRTFGIFRPVSKDGIAQLTAFIKASKVVPQRGLLMWIMASILSGYALMCARLPWVLPLAVPHFKTNPYVLATVLNLPAIQSDYILHTIKQISNAFDYNRNWTNEEVRLRARMRCALTLGISEQLFLDCLVDAHNRHMTLDRFDTPQVNRACIDFINEELDNFLTGRYSKVYDVHSYVQAIFLNPDNLDILAHIGGRQLAWILNGAFDKSMQHWFDHKSECFDSALARLRRLWPSLQLNGELRMLDSNEIERLDRLVHDENVSLWHDGEYCFHDR